MEIKTSGIDKVITKLRNYSKSLEFKQQKLMERLAEIGIDRATIKFSQAQYDGDNDVIVEQTPQWIGENKLIIQASGTTVLFIEFGTGAGATLSPNGKDFGFERGGYGKGKGKNDTWTYYGVAGTNGQYVTTRSKGDVYRTKGNPPAMAMYDAAKDMRDKISEIAREVFSE